MTLLQECLHRYGYRISIDGGFGPITDATGCWRLEVSIRVGLDIFSGFMRVDGMRTAYRRYNGSGPAADAMSRTPGFQHIVGTF
ncbi:MAG: hypothetical protein ACRDSR_02640 [Pseudonocardiaceae bacterium]